VGSAETAGRSGAPTLWGDLQEPRDYRAEAGCRKVTRTGS
jgi:hypothetical protein